MIRRPPRSTLFPYTPLSQSPHFEPAATLASRLAAREISSRELLDHFQERVERHNPDRKSTRLNSSHGYISYAVFCLKKKKNNPTTSNLICHNRSRANTYLCN